MFFYNNIFCFVDCQKYRAANRVQVWWWDLAKSEWWSDWWILTDWCWTLRSTSIWEESSKDWESFTEIWNFFFKMLCFEYHYRISIELTRNQLIIHGFCGAFTDATDIIGKLSLRRSRVPYEELFLIYTHVYMDNYVLKCFALLHFGGNRKYGFHQVYHNIIY